MFLFATRLSAALLLVISLWPNPAYGFMTPEIIRAMEEAKLCQRIQQESIYIECMDNNNRYLSKSIEYQSLRLTQDFSKVKKKRTLTRINQALKNNLKRCLEEQAVNRNSPMQQKRYRYCLYENMLELLINVNKRSEIYSKP